MRLAIANFSKGASLEFRTPIQTKFVTVEHRDQHARRVRYPGVSSHGKFY